MMNPMFFSMFDLPNRLQRIVIGAGVLALVGAVVSLVAVVLYSLGANLVFVIPALAVCYLVGWFLEVFE